MDEGVTLEPLESEVEDDLDQDANLGVEGSNDSGSDSSDAPPLIPSSSEDDRWLRAQTKDDSDPSSSEDDTEEMKAFYETLYQMKEKVARGAQPSKGWKERMTKKESTKRPGCRGNFVHMFSGPKERLDGIAAHLGALRWECEDIDQVNVEATDPWRNDLTQERTWDRIDVSTRERKVDAMGAGVPCETFSRSRNNRPGPTPLRSKQYPYGKPE